ncbi:MAG: polysaccharide biosynthesis protein PslG, partial [Gaiellaceae bacterium]|nr:polysaccharide biosynthesis protein PslG [Gaiellaceae bacterium]
MRGHLRRIALALAAALVVAPSALGGTPIRVGAVEDAAKWGDPAAKMDLARSAGFDTVRMTAQWSAGQTAPSAGELTNLQNAAGAATARGIKPIVAIYNAGSGSTPADDASRAQFVQYATAVVKGLPSVQTFILGNEPNSNVYWLPQFDAAGTDVAATAYEQLLAASYDAIKAVRPTATVVGGALDPRGGDVAGGSKPTHSPTSFVRDLGAAYRASGRTLPIMDVFDHHVYADNSGLPPSMSHPNTTTIAEADYGKLVALLGQAFDGTAQPGSSLPILYGEFGVESVIPAAKSGAYSGTEPSTTKPVDEATQAAYYTEAFKLAMCQPNVIGILIFHVTDESALAAWQSGPFYADDTAKSSLNAIRDAASAARAGTLTSCPDQTVPTATLSSPAGGTLV